MKPIRGAVARRLAGFWEDGGPPRRSKTRKRCGNNRQDHPANTAESAQKYVSLTLRKPSLNFLGITPAADAGWLERGIP